MGNTILKDIVKFAKKAKGCKLSADILEGDYSFMKRVDTYFNTTRFQSLMIVAIFEMNSEEKKPGLVELAKYFKSNTIELFVYKKELDQLQDCGIFTDKFSWHFRLSGETQFFISEKVRDSIVANIPFEEVTPKVLDPLEICDAIMRLINKLADSRSDKGNLYDNFNGLLNKYASTDFVKYLTKQRLCDEDLMAYIYIIAYNIDGHTDCEISSFSKGIFENKKDRLLYEKSIHDNKTALISSHYAEVNEATFFSHASVSITAHRSKELEALGIPIRLKSNSNKIPLIAPAAISKKRLFYDFDTTNELDTITKSLRPLKYKQIVKSLKAEGLRTGVCTLFYGAPGTGKTEGVYQIAKTTGRAVWKVDISELKSMYFGESQKLVKALFKNYKSLTKREKRTPILLLNEADAILGARNANSSTSTDKTNSSIQNIFLDCLEDFEGILFATTNLPESLDPAFERRFLFKICFERPTIEARCNIWQTKVKGLKKEVALNLATNYDLSGGEIENIARKFKMNRILSPSIELSSTLSHLCESEKLKSNTKKRTIGF